MNNILAAAARATLGAVLVLAVLAAMLLAVYGPQGLWVIAWLVVMCAVIAGAVLGVSALYPEGDER